MRFSDRSGCFSCLLYSTNDMGEDEQTGTVDTCCSEIKLVGTCFLLPYFIKNEMAPSTHSFLFFYRNHLFRLNLEDLTLIQVSVNSLSLRLIQPVFWGNLYSFRLLISLSQGSEAPPASNKCGPRCCTVLPAPTS